MPANSTTNPIPAGFGQVRLISPSGTSTFVNFEQGTTLDVFLQQQGISAVDNTVRVDRQPATSNQQLQNGQVVSATPAKVAGARRRR